MEPNQYQEYFNGIINALEAIEDAQTRLAIVAELEFLSKLTASYPAVWGDTPPKAVIAAIEARMSELIGPGLE